MGRKVQLLLVTCTNTFPPFSTGPVILYLLLLKVKARSNKGFRALEDKFSNKISVPWHPKGVAEPQARSLHAVLESICGTWIQPSQGDEVTSDSGADSIRVTGSCTSKSDLCLRMACSHTSLRTGVFQMGKPELSGCISRKPSWTHKAVLAPPQMPRCSHTLCSCGWHWPAGPSRQDTSEAQRTGSLRDRVVHRAAEKLTLSTITEGNEGLAPLCLRSGSGKNLPSITKKERPACSIFLYLMLFQTFITTTECSASHLSPRSREETFLMFPTGAKSRPCKPERWV